VEVLNIWQEIVEIEEQKTELERVKDWNIKEIEIMNKII